MSLTTNTNGSTTLSEKRHLVCLEAAWELDAVAEMLLTINGDGTPEETNAGYKTRCVVSRLKELSSVLSSGLSDEDEETSDLERKLNLTA